MTYSIGTNYSDECRIVKVLMKGQETIQHELPKGTTHWSKFIADRTLLNSTALPLATWVQIVCNNIFHWELYRPHHWSLESHIIFT